MDSTIEETMDALPVFNAVRRGKLREAMEFKRNTFMGADPAAIYVPTAPNPAGGYLQVVIADELDR